jgi:alkylated DNA repair dioxygenase AlkB
MHSQCQARVETVSHNYGYYGIRPGNARGVFHLTKLSTTSHEQRAKQIHDTQLQGTRKMKNYRVKPKYSQRTVPAPICSPTAWSMTDRTSSLVNSMDCMTLWMSCHLSAHHMRGEKDIEMAQKEACIIKYDWTVPHSCQHFLWESLVCTGWYQLKLKTTVKLLPHVLATQN